ncbi:beta family protein [Pseudomonas aeruginosa]|uniref:beta family protein n=1 Tax=Pseudomonas aeruginosa TaxID=287 RepID=UPI001495C94E|nr:protein beta [Pseudomonas aeruginosa]MBV6227749.1 beta family protein [Pseudomonas aeruginosa]NPT01636.1 protein beta [Pseudomonas aeruginosa]HBO1307401.1 beta family protein [Pseudomonas aeruginosa]HBO6772674.1 protein beta [Pseudomonas aeruginosa]HCF9255631.1 beta family protein [Pseudomonas aeruginosa]
MKFDDFLYYPSLRTRPAEVKGYSELTAEEKSKIIPIFVAGLWPRQNELKASMGRLFEASGDSPIILDITTDPNYTSEETWMLRDPNNNFSNWRKFVSQQDANIVPVVQITEDSKLSSIIRQARAFESVGKLAFKIRRFGQDTKEIIAALSALDDAENALVIIDAGYIRETLSASLAGCVTAINEIRDEVSDAVITVISTSFPASVVPFLDANSKGERGVISMLETKLHAAIGSDAAIYGDHGSIHSRVYIAKGGRYTPRIDYPLNDAWVFERRPDTDSTGYIDAASTLIEAYSEINDDDSWGARMIRNAANGEIDGMKTPASWIAARVNMHISKQIYLNNDAAPTDEEDLDDII